MCVIYALSYHVDVKKDHERLILSRETKKIASVPLYEVTSIVVGRTAHLSSQLLFSFMEREIPIYYVNGCGELVGSCGADMPRLDHLLAQMAAFHDQKRRHGFLHAIVQQKIRRQQDLLHSYAKRKKSHALMELSKKVAAVLNASERASNDEALRGLEGTAARLYFSAFPEMLGSDFPWPGRQQHPAHEPVNALLNYGYAFLEREVRLALIGSGLDARIGCFHVDTPRRDSLVYDLMEPYRSIIIDRFVLKLLNCKTLTTAHFVTTPDGCLLTDNGRKLWCFAYESFLEKPSKTCGACSPRALLRKEIAAFAKDVFRSSDTQSA